MSALLPPIIALKGDVSNKYMIYDATIADERYGSLAFTGTNVYSSLAKFQVVVATTGAGLVHLRCSENKKFIRMTSSASIHLSPEADEPEEDQSKWSCTLLKPQVAGHDKATFLHVHTKQYASVMTLNSISRWSLQIQSLSNSVFGVIDLERKVILPKHGALKGDNDLYLRYAGSAGAFKFMSSDKGGGDSGFEVSTDGDGQVDIKHIDTSKYLMLSNANALYPGDTPTKFWPAKIGATTVALRCVNNNLFCCRYNPGDVLSANSASINQWAHLTLEERVFSRKIYNTNFDLVNAIIYDETPITMATANASNNTSAANTAEFKFTYKDSKSSTWTSSHSWMVGVSVTVEFKVPFIGGTEVTTNAEYSGSYEWGETVTTENSLETTYTVTVPPLTSISVSLMATKGKCDVPYSYYQKDLLYNGLIEIFKKDDGLYTGINSYNFRYVVTTQEVEKPDTKADLPNKEQKLPDPSTGPSKEESIPLPSSSGSTTVQTKETTTTTAPLGARVVIAAGR